MSFNLTRKTDYGLVALARLSEQSNAEKEPLSAREIAEKYELPLPLLMNVLKDLHRAGIVCSRRGAAGGYHLCKDAGQISLLQVIEAIEGKVQVALCCDDAAEKEPCTGCRVSAKCPITEPMQRFDELVRGFLARISLKDIISDRSYVQLTRTLGAVPLVAPDRLEKLCSHS
jgi:Rrf2 family protein